MIPRPLREIAQEVDGRLVGDDARVDRVVTDSRDAGPGALFVALRGERHDGARFVPEAVAAGAAGVLVAEGTPSSGPRIEVPSTGEALLRLASAERDRIPMCVAITGANGKTTTKDMTAAVVAVTRTTSAAPGSFNNEVGLPMTLLGAPPGTEVVVAELGARRKGDVTMLCEIARPEIAVVTNVGVAHMEIFGSWDAIVEASAEPVDALGPGDTAVLNADDPIVFGYRRRCAGRVVTFGLGRDADVRADDVALDVDGAASFTLAIDDARVPVTLPRPGEHLVPDALAAAAVGHLVGVAPTSLAAALGAVEVSRWRMESFVTPGGVRVVNDAYNANPESMAAALKAARAMAGDGRLIAVLGHMAELGPIAGEAHERVGDLAARLRVDRLVAVGPDAEPIAVAAVREGMAPDDVVAVADVGAAVDDLRRHAGAGDVVLCKGSRVAGLEALAEALR